MPHFKIEYEPVELRLKQVFTISRGSKPSVTNVMLRLQAGGVVGWGEAAPNTRYDEDADRVIAWLEGLPDDLLDEVESPEDFEERLTDYQTHHVTVHAARAALETAWLDWWGRSQGLPLWQLWDAPARKGPVTSFTIGLDEPEVMRQKVIEADQEGYPVLKVKLGTERDRQILETIREVTDKPIRVDANEGWETMDQAKQAIDLLAGRNIEMIEQPMPARAFDEMIRLREFSPIPLCADESFEGEEDLEEIARAFDIINVKLMKIGSLVRARRVISEARYLGLKIMIGCMIESSVANTAGALLALWADYADLDGHLLISDDPYRGLFLDEGKMVCLSDSPGLGITRRR